jgi:hypothetical protein
MNINHKIVIYFIYLLFSPSSCHDAPPLYLTSSPPPPPPHALPPPPHYQPHLPFPLPLPLSHPYSFPCFPHGSNTPMGWFPAIPNPPIPTNTPEPAKQIIPQPTNPPKQICHPHPWHKPGPPKHLKTIHIDQKTFEITQVGGKNYPFCIMESKFGKLLGKIWIGSKDIDWLGTSVDKTVHYGKTGDFFQHCRDGYKALHVIRCFNQHGERIPLLCLSKTLNLPQQSHNQHTLWTIQSDRMDPLGFMKKTS